MRHLRHSCLATVLALAACSGGDEMPIVTIDGPDEILVYGQVSPTTRFECAALVNAVLTRGTTPAGWTGATITWRNEQGIITEVEQVSQAETISLWGDDSVRAGPGLSRYLTVSTPTLFSVDFAFRFTTRDGHSGTAPYGIRCITPTPPLVGVWQLRSINGQSIPGPGPFGHVIHSSTLSFIAGLRYGWSTTWSPYGQMETIGSSTSEPYWITAPDSLLLPYIATDVRDMTVSFVRDTIRMTHTPCCNNTTAYTWVYTR